MLPLLTWALFIWAWVSWRRFLKRAREVKEYEEKYIEWAKREAVRQQRIRTQEQRNANIDVWEELYGRKDK
jgi:ribosomal protein L17